MNRVMVLVMLFAVLSAVAQVVSPLREIRYCGPPLRGANGAILRSAKALAAYRRAHPCPATLAFVGACPGWAVNHVVPLACGGCDAVWNMMWVATDVKTCAGPHCIDRVERRISASTPPQPDTDACINRITP